MTLDQSSSSSDDSSESSTSSSSSEEKCLTPVASEKENLANTHEPRPSRNKRQLIRFLDYDMS